MFRAGDSVFHRPSGETWVLACDELDGEVMQAGWPESYAKASDCELKRAVTDEKRLEWLADVSKSRDDRGQPSRRARLAFYQLHGRAM